MRFQKTTKVLAAILAAAMFLTGCNAARGNTEKETATENSQATTGEETAQSDASEENGGMSGSNALAQELQKKYSAAGDAAAYDGNVIKVDREEALQIELGYNPWDTDTSIYDSFVIYQDAELKYPVEAGSYDYNAETGILTIEPPFFGIAEMGSGDDVTLNHLSGSYLEEDENDKGGWGTLPQYYFAATVDLETGKKLEKPIITVIRINSEITTAPQVTFDQTQEGLARFSWDAVPGAEGYLVFLINKDEKGFWEYTKVFADTKQTSWVSEQHEFEGSVLSMNARFRQYYTSEDSEAWIEDTDSFLKDYADDVAYDEYYSEYFGVIAYNSEGSSPISNLFSAADLAHMLPYEMASYTNEETFYGIDGVQDLPAVMWITMCDGSTAQRVIQYDIKNYEKNEASNSIHMIANGEQTPFTQELIVSNINFDSLDAELEALQERQEKLKNKGGNVAPQISMETETKEPEATQAPAATQAPEATKEPKATEIPKATAAPQAEGSSQITITANSALSEYLALHMMENNNAIDISAFNEAADTEKVVDAFFEAQYQNPLILGIQGGSFDDVNRVLYVEYDFSKEETSEKQAEIKTKIEQITNKIITDDMSDMEKEIAINTYLCQNSEYDNEALENAEEHSFTRVDESFYDSFTAYGILVDGKGVCASYSAAFKLLADAAGLESIVVTGYLEGSVPHAWNKVKLEDNWYILDSTNNDNEMIENALLNLSDEAACDTLVEDERFAMDESLGCYRASEDSLEYYHSTGRYYEVEEVSGELADLLAQDGKAVLRTDYYLDDETFYGIAQQAADQSQKDINGFYWMGVIRLEE